MAEYLGIPVAVGEVFAAVIVVSFAATTMDTGVRLQRYIITELGEQYRVRPLRNPTVATTLAVGSCLLLAFGAHAPGGGVGSGGLVIWPLFGTTNQLTAGLSLLIVSIFLLKLRRNIWITVVPMGFLLFMTTWAMIGNLIRYWSDSEALLLAVGGAIFVLELWLIFEAVMAFRKALDERNAEGAGETQRTA